MIISRNNTLKNRFEIGGVQEAPEAKKSGIAGFHGGISALIGWIVCRIFCKAVRVEINDKVYFLNCKSLDNWRKRVAPDVAAAKNMHDPKAVKEMIQSIITSKKPLQPVQAPKTSETPETPPQQPTTPIQPKPIDFESDPMFIEKKLLHGGEFNSYAPVLIDLIHSKSPISEIGFTLKNQLSAYIKEAKDLTPLNDLLGKYQTEDQTEKFNRLYDTLKYILDQGWFCQQKEKEVEVKKLVLAYSPEEYVKNGNYDLAKKRLDDTDLLNIADVHYFRDELKKALEIVKNAADPNSERAEKLYNNIGHKFLKREETDDAYLAFMEVFVNPIKDKNLKLVAEQYFNKQEYDKAIGAACNINDIAKVKSLLKQFQEQFQTSSNDEYAKKVNDILIKI